MIHEFEHNGINAIIRRTAKYALHVDGWEMFVWYPGEPLAKVVRTEHDSYAQARRHLNRIFADSDRH